MFKYYKIKFEIIQSTTFKKYIIFVEKHLLKNRPYNNLT